MTAGSPVVAVLGTLDTKGSEVAYLAEVVREQGYAPYVIDLGMMGTPATGAQARRSEVARAAGASLDALIAGERIAAMAAMASGAARLLSGLQDQGLLAGVVAVGGGKGTWMATAAMRTLPFGLPKVMVSTGAGRDVRHLVGNRDITMMPSIADIAGLNRITRPVLAAAAGAICGMARSRLAPSPPAGPAIALTMFGITTPCGQRVQDLLTDQGRETIVFHANGMGGATLEELIGEGLISAVIDLTTTELADEFLGGICSAGPHRLEAAGRRGLPQVVAPGALDAVNFGPPESVPSRYAGRRFVSHTPAVTLMRTTPDENLALGRIMAAKLAAAQGPVAVLVPEGGFSAYDRVGQPFHDPEADAAFVQGLRASLRADVPLRMLPYHINDPAFAEALVAAVQPLLDAGQSATAPSREASAG